MKTDNQPYLPRRHQAIIIQPQCFNCSSATGGLTQNMKAIAAPDKMLAPDLL